MVEMLNISPTTDSLNGKQAANITWATLLAEIIDNSIDAKASRVIVTFGTLKAKTLVVEDDGVGCGDVAVMLTEGKRHSHGIDSMGRYGLGLKNAAHCMWGQMDIKTRHEGIAHKICADWEQMKASGKWEIPAATKFPTNDPSGTILTFTRMRKEAPHGFGSLIDELRYIFTPGLLRGIQIQFILPRNKRELLKPYEWPQLEDTIEDTFTVDGKGVRLRGGIVKEGVPNKKPGFAYCHLHRIILPACGIGAGEHSTRRISGQVWLDDKWRLTVHKDDFVWRDKIAIEVERRMLPLLKKADTQAEDLASSAFDKKLNASLQGVMEGYAKSQRKARRDKGKKKGTQEGTCDGSKHTNATKTQPGDGLPPKRMGKISLRWIEMDEGYGRIDGNKTTIWLNETHEHLKRLRRKENIDAILMLGFGLYVEDALGTTTKQQMMLPGIKDKQRSADFSTVWADVMANVNASEE